jgi:PhnB protein
MRISLHLTFDGQCRAAFNRYHAILGGSIRTMLSYGESPLAPQVESRWHERIVHATLVCDDVELTGVDVMPSDYRLPQGFFVTITVDEVGRASQIFDAFATGGTILMPFQKTFWSPGFGVVIDQYQVPWEINVA